MIDPRRWSALVTYYTPKILRHRERGFVGPCRSGGASSFPTLFLSVALSGAPGSSEELAWCSSGAGSSGMR